MSRPPVVTDIDRKWALDKCPPWAARGDLDHAPLLEIDPDEVPRANRASNVLNWDMFVADQIERFEAYFATERKPADDWSRLWRKVWWPKADPSILHPKLVPQSAKTFHPYFRRGSAEFERALAVAAPMERKVFDKIGVAQFKPDDPRLDRVRGKAA